MKQVKGKQWIALLLTGVFSVSAAGCGKQAETIQETPLPETVATLVETQEKETVLTTEETVSEEETAETYVFEETAIDLPEHSIWMRLIPQRNVWRI